MKTIYKYVLTPNEEVSVPEDSEFLSVGAQGDKVVIWFKVDTARPLETIKFELRGTGSQVGDVGEFLGTAQLECGIVIHVFRGTYHE